jgi:hypothetical protein
VTLLLALLMAAEAFSAPLTLPKAARVEMTVERSREDVRAGQTQRSASQTRYEKIIETQGDGYRVTLKPLETKLPDTPSAAQAEAALGDLMKRTLIYTADEDLAPQAIEGWPVLAAEVTKAMSALGGSTPEASKGIAAMTSMFSSMTAEQAASVFLKEDGFQSIPVNVELDPAKPAAGTEIIASPLGGPPIKSIVTLSVESVDKARGVATLKWAQILDPESTQASVTQMVEAILQRMGPEAAKSAEMRAKFEKMVFDRTSTCDFEVALNTGLPTKTTCEARLKVTDPATGQLNGRTERWVITQTLKTQ